MLPPVPQPKSTISDDDRVAVANLAANSRLRKRESTCSRAVSQSISGELMIGVEFRSKNLHQWRGGGEVCWLFAGSISLQQHFANVCRTEYTLLHCGYGGCSPCVRNILYHQFGCSSQPSVLDLGHLDTHCVRTKGMGLRTPLLPLMWAAFECNCSRFTVGLSWAVRGGPGQQVCCLLIAGELRFGFICVLIDWHF